jgi:peptidyl-prolyl cis-trans isomerase A (cyclophilin A)
MLEMQVMSRKGRPDEPKLTASRAVLGVVMSLAVFATPAFGQTAALSNPAALTEKAPATYKARFDTSKGTVLIEVHRDWAPNGADRFYNLVKNGFYDNDRFFRVIKGFMVQFGINGDPSLSSGWRAAAIPDDPVKQTNKRGYVTFATAGPNSRTTQVFVNFAENTGLDGQGFAPFGQVVAGMDVVDQLFGGYGEGAPRGQGPDQSRVQREGNDYLMKEFPKLDFVKKATIEK